jgi:DNA-binding SARP family transcriptional activator
MHFRILGPLEVLDQGEGVSIGGSKQRALLALLLLHANEPLSTDRLVDALWGERPPATAAKTVQVHVSRLRKTLAGANGGGADGPVVTREHGYELVLDPGALDAHRFAELVAEGREHLAAGRRQPAAAALERALAMWRGPPLADVASEPFAQPAIARLEDLRVTAQEALVEAKLALGDHAEVVGTLEALVAAHPYRERLRAQLMLALYRSDRQAEALQAYQDARRTLVEDLGIEPGERLRELERAVLAQDPALALPDPAAGGLPPELDDGTLMAGREAELAWLREHWRRAQGGAGHVVLVRGPPGIGKTRLAAELAAEVRRDGADVRYVAGPGPHDVAPAELARARDGRGPALVVVDDVGAGPADGGLRPAVGALAEELAGAPVLVVATAQDGAAPAAEATLDLGPLGADGVRAVAELYAGARAGADVPVAELLAASGGVPERVHRVASEWVRTAAARRLEASARRAAGERRELRAAEDELAGDVVALQTIRERAERRGGARDVVACPFKGLAAFEEEDAGVFFGRERLVADLVARLAGAPLLAVVGPSGSGKSSALRAGLLAALAAGVLPGSERWGIALLRPGEHPLEALDRAIAGTHSDGRLVVAVDQFEELFTACRDAAERSAFVDALVAHTRDLRRRTLVLVAVRADFYGRCAVYPELSRLLGANHVLVGPMRRDELRRAIELPAHRAGLDVEPDLTDALLADMEGEPGALPLLSTCLLELWRERDGRRLRLSAYEHAGGVRGAVARLAEGTYARLDPDLRPIARRILVRLAGEGDGDAVVRRRVPLASLGADRDERTGAVLGVLADDRLVTIGAGAVEVAHEALLREWPRLRGWLAADAEGRRLHRRLAEAARDWEAGGRDPGELYRGARLTAAIEWAGGHEHELDGGEAAFLAESVGAAEREGDRQRRTNRRLRGLLTGVAALLALAVVAGVLALDQRGAARDQAVAADAQRLGLARAGGGRSRPCAAARPPERRARRHGADAREPPRRARQEPGGDRRPARRGRAHVDRDPQPGWAHPRCR